LHELQVACADGDDDVFGLKYEYESDGNWVNDVIIVIYFLCFYLM